MNVKIFCITLNPNHEKVIKKLSYVPVGLGGKVFSKNCLSDKIGLNISSKNPYYGEYTFHYWIWKNYLDEIKTDWVGFCQYRKFFIKNNLSDHHLDFKNFNNILVKEIESHYQNYDCILGNKFSVKNYKISKILKNHLKFFLERPSLFFNKQKRNLKLHFDIFHGKGNLDAAINLLDEENKYGFKNYMNNQTEFNPHNMFICKTKILKDYYNVIFPWLNKCENLFGLKDREDYGLKRIYGFLAERFLSYWFNKNYNIIELPIIGKDLSDYKNL